jgi:hypothetical protein
MKLFNVSFEISVESTDPLSAAETVQNWLRDGYWIFTVQDTETNQIFSVDLDTYHLDEENDDTIIEIKKEDYKPLI